MFAFLLNSYDGSVVGGNSANSSSEYSDWGEDHKANLQPPTRRSNRRVVPARARSPIYEYESPSQSTQSCAATSSGSGTQDTPSKSMRRVKRRKKTRRAKAKVSDGLSYVQCDIAVPESRYVDMSPSVHSCFRC